jgi:hypothetical protein
MLKGFYMTTLTTEEVLEMARQVGLSVENPQLGYTERHHVAGWITDLEDFAKLVDSKATAREREACAKVIENDCIDDMTREEEAAAIRARGEPTSRGGEA